MVCGISWAYENTIFVNPVIPEFLSSFACSTPFFHSSAIKGKK